MKHRLWLSLILPVLIAGCISTRVIKNISVDDYQLITQEKYAYYTNQYPFQDAVYLSYSQQHINDLLPIAESDTPNLETYINHLYQWTYHKSTRSKKIVLNNQAFGLNTFSLTISPGDFVNAFSVEVLSPGGAYQVYSLEKCVKEADSGKNITYKLILPSLAEGAIISEAVDISRNFQL